MSPLNYFYHTVSGVSCFHDLRTCEGEAKFDEDAVTATCNGKTPHSPMRGRRRVTDAPTSSRWRCRRRTIAFAAKLVTYSAGGRNAVWS